MSKTLYKPIIIVWLIIFFISPNLLLAKTANDPLNSELYYLGPIQVESAWDYTTGSKSVVVAVIDTGVDIDHPDIYENIWENIDEIAGDGIDNDHNGYIDDRNGWDFIHNEADPNPKFDSKYSELGIEHGTLVAGIIGARGNNGYGVTGLNWQVSIMPLVALDGQGNGTIEDVVRAMNYAIDNGADVINLSLVGSTGYPTLATAIQRAYDQDIIVVAATGNESGGGSSQDVSVDMGLNPRYPVCFDGQPGQNYILGVGSIDYQDKKSLFSNYGQTCLDISTPGQGFFGLTIYQPIFANYREKFDGYWSGTSLATGVVSGAAALVRAYRPSLSNQEIYNLLLDNADELDSKNSNYVGKMGAGKLNLAKVFSQASLLAETNLSASRVVAPQTGYEPRVEIYDQVGKLQTSWLAYNQSFRGGVNVAVAGEQIITGAGQFGGPHVRVFDLAGNLISEWFALDGKNNHGVKVAAWGNKIVTWSGDHSYPDVQIYSDQGQLLSQFKVDKYIYDLAVGNSDSDKQIEINILTTKQILVYSQLGILERTIDLDTTAGQISVSNNKFILSAHSEQAPYIWIYDQVGKLQTSWLAYNQNFRGGVNVAVAGEQIVTGAGQSGGPHVRVFDLAGNLQTEWFALDFKTNGGINVGLVD